MQTARPSWLPGEDIYPDHDARALIESAWDLAGSACDSALDLRSRTLCALLVSLRSDAILVATGLLVFAYREGRLDRQTLIEHCGQNVLSLLEGLETLDLIDHLHERKNSDLEQLRKMLLAMARDMRVVVLKLALQVVAMRGVTELSPEKRQRLALQSRDLFAPLANRMGIAQLKFELEDSALHILEPDIYQEIATALEERRVDRERYIERIIAELKQTLDEADVPILRIYGRVKHINSIYLKMKRKHLRFEQINDIRAVRVEVQTKEQCYQVLSVVTDLWRPLTEEFDDYIAHPKENGYQSLHSTLIGPEGRRLEIQIRTRTMHEHAELGMAAHWKYKEKTLHHSQRFERQIEWLRRMLEGSGDVARGDVVFDQFRNEAFRERVYAVTPQGMVVDLPEGATALDFAYHVHTQLGHRCKGAKINDHMVSLTTALKNGDTVEILTYKKAQPSLDWLSDHLGYLHSARAKAKVRSYFKKQEKAKSIALGRDMLSHELRRLGIAASGEDMPELCHKFNVQSMDDLYAGIGFGDLGLLTVAHELIACAEARRQPEKPSLDERIARIPVRASRRRKGQYIEVDGVEDLMINFATCCHPVPHCAITGFISQGRGINIHRSDCANIMHLARQYPERIVEVRWSEDSEGQYAIDIAILAYDRPHLLREMTRILANERVPILGVAMAHNHHEQLQGKFSVEVSDMGQLSRVINRLGQIKGVSEVNRL